LHRLLVDEPEPVKVAGRQAAGLPANLSSIVHDTTSAASCWQRPEI